MTSKELNTAKASLQKRFISVHETVLRAEGVLEMVQEKGVRMPEYVEIHADGVILTWVSSFAPNRGVNVVIPYFETEEEWMSYKENVVALDVSAIKDLFLSKEAITHQTAKARLERLHLLAWDMLSVLGKECECKKFQCARCFAKGVLEIVKGGAE